jgi:chromosomal replication initiator protein
MKPQKPDYIYIVSNSANAHGYKDFLNTIKPSLKTKTHSLFIDGRSRGGIIDKLETYNFNPGDMICIVRGGGDTSHESFRAYHSAEAAIYLLELINKGVIVVTGIGHQSDDFIVETHVNYRCITPTAAGVFVNNYFDGYDGDTIDINDLLSEPAPAPELTFDRFVASNMNAVIKSVCLAVSEQPKPDYTPIIIRGRSGLGKSHLLRAIENNAHLKQPSMQVRYFTAKDLLDTYNDFSFRQVPEMLLNHIKSFDILLIDDFESFQGNEIVQQRLSEVIDYFISCNKSLVLTAGNSFDHLSATLRNCLNTCTVFTLEDLKKDDCRKITMEYIDSLGMVVSKDIIEKIINRPNFNFREMRGIVNTIRAYSQHSTNNGENNDIDYTSLLDEHFEMARFDFKDVVKTVCQHYKISKSDVFSKSRKTLVSRARQMIMFLAYEHLDMSYPDIGELLSRDHTTVLSGVDKIKNLLKTDDILISDLNQIESDLT